MKNYKNFIFESNGTYKLTFQLKTDISQFNFNELISKTILEFPNNLTDLLELFFMIKPDIKLDKLDFYNAVVKPGHQIIRMKSAEVLVKKGHCDVNQLIYVNGIYS